MHDDSGSQMSIAELSRPGRRCNEVVHDRRKTKTGRKRMHSPSDAKYANWHCPFLWTQITDAAKVVGWQMSASAIRDQL